MKTKKEIAVIKAVDGTKEIFFFPSIEQAVIFVSKDYQKYEKKFVDTERFNCADTCTKEPTFDDEDDMHCDLYDTKLRYAYINAYDTHIEWIIEEKGDRRMKNEFYKNDEGWNYVSKNGIHYNLFEGMTFGREKQFTSGIVFIMLLENVEDNFFEEYINKWPLGHLVDWMSVADFDELYSSDRAGIIECVNSFESKNAEMIEFIKTHQFTNTVEITMEVTHMISLQYKVTSEEYDNITKGLLPDRIRNNMETTIKEKPDSCNIYMDWTALDSETGKTIQEWT